MICFNIPKFLIIVVPLLLIDAGLSLTQAALPVGLVLENSSTITTTEMAPESHVAAPTYAAIRNISLKITRRYLPSNTIIVGTDPSVIPFLTFLELRYPGSTHTLALCNFNYNPYQPEISVGYTFNHRPLEQTFVAMLFRHWDEFFPTAADIGNRRILLIGQQGDGSALFALHNYLQLYFKSRHRQHSVVLLMMTAKENINAMQLAAARFRIPTSTEAIVFPLDSFPSLLNSLTSGQFDQYGPYTSFDITTHGYPRSNAAYHDFQLAMGRYMAHDSKSGFTQTVSFSCQGKLVD
jgi:hypothetical protein